MKIWVLTLSLLLAASPAWADDITDQINEGLKAYGRKDLPTNRAEKAEIRRPVLLRLHCHNESSPGPHDSHIVTGTDPATP